MLLHEIENYIAVCASDTVKSVSGDFLQQHGLTHFSYARMYKDLSEFCLSTHPEMIVDFYRHEFYKVTDYQADFSDHPAANLLWLFANEKEQQLFRHAKEYYDCTNGIVLIRNHDNYQEQFYYATTSQNYSANNFYINNIEELENFGKSFLEKAETIISQCHQNPILNLERQGFGSQDPYRRMKECQSLVTDKLHRLSKREMQLLQHLALGLSCKNIANRLELKVKTIYTYVEHLKEKLDVTSRDGLVNHYWKHHHRANSTDIIR